MRIISLVILLSLSCQLYGQKFIKEGEPIPLTAYLGLIKINESTWIDASEVLASDWLEFLYYQDVQLYTRQDSLDLSFFQNYQVDASLLPDKTLAKNYTWLFKPVTQLTQFERPISVKKPSVTEEPKSIKRKNGKEEIITYTESPVMGVSFEQAQKFCRWRTSRDSIIAASHGWSFWFRYRLPTIEEFKAIDYEVDSIDWSKRKKDVGSSYNYKGAVQKVYPEKGSDKFIGLYYGMGKGPMSVCLDFGRLRAGERKPCNIKGNLSEMTNQKGVAMGGNYQLYASEYRIGDRINYTRPEPWLGFRCIAELVSR